MTTKVMIPIYKADRIKDYTAEIDIDMIPQHVWYAIVRAGLKIELNKHMHNLDNANKMANGKGREATHEAAMTIARQNVLNLYKGTTLLLKPDRKSNIGLRAHSS